LAILDGFVGFYKYVSPLVGVHADSSGGLDHEVVDLVPDALGLWAAVGDLDQDARVDGPVEELFRLSSASW
jgi:hypothetical protein